jgi:hypothetical protein
VQSGLGQARTTTAGWCCSRAPPCRPGPPPRTAPVMPAWSEPTPTASPDPCPNREVRGLASAVNGVRILLEALPPLVLPALWTWSIHGKTLYPALTFLWLACCAAIALLEDNPGVPFVRRIPSTLNA